MTKVKLSDSMTLGFALFAMFFGAGNLIFPPFLGYTSGANWFIGFVFFIAADAGLSLLALYVIARVGHGAEGITEVLGNKVSKLFLAISCLCIGPFIAIPRTGAITYELGVAPLVNVSSIVVTVIFFLICFVLSIRRSQIVDMIGKFLSPLMFAALMVLVIKGIIDPVGEINFSGDLAPVIKSGITSGYQTMDMMGAAVLSVAVVYEINQKGHTTPKAQFRIITSSGLVCGLLLFIVYGGLAFLGATASGNYPAGMTQTGLLTTITRTLMGDAGLIILAIIVACACMTTAVGLMTSVSSFFSDLTGNRVSYEAFVVIFTLFSLVVSNFGISTIISMAAPVLEVIYPVLIVLTVLRVFDSHIRDKYIYYTASVAAIAVSFLSTLGSLLGFSFGLERLPLADLGFEWVLPTAAAVLIAVIVSLARGRGLHEKLN